MAVFAVLWVWMSIAYSRPRPTPRLPENHLRVPLVRQATDYSCGPAALQSVLYYWSVYRGFESALYPFLGTTPKEGTDTSALADGAIHFGLEAHLVENLSFRELRQFLKEGSTTILAVQAWHAPWPPESSGPDYPKWPGWKDDWADGHFIVLVGMDRYYAYFMDPSSSGAYAYMPLPELEERWHDVANGPTYLHHVQHPAVVIRGSSPIRTYPSDLARIF